MPVVTVSDRAGRYVVEDERPDGRLVLRPAQPAFLEPGERIVSLDELEAVTGAKLLPPDGEG